MKSEFTIFELGPVDKSLFVGCGALIKYPLYIFIMVIALLNLNMVNFIYNNVINMTLIVITS
jgi:hypothetical protein